MAQGTNNDFTLQDFTKFSLACAGFGGVSGGVVGGVGHYLLGFRQVTPLTGLVTGTVFGGLGVLAVTISMLATKIIVLDACGLKNEDILNCSIFGGGAILDFVVTPLVTGLVGFPIVSYWQFLAQLVAQAATLALAIMCLPD